MADNDVPEELKRQDIEAHIFEKLEKRRTEKSTHYAQKLVEREEQNKESQGAINQLDSWLSKLNLSLDQRVANLNTTNEDTVDVTTFLDNTAIEIQKIEAFFAEKSNFILAYEVRRIQNSVLELKTKYQAVQDLLQPKKKFGFRGNKKKQDCQNASKKIMPETKLKSNFSNSGYQVNGKSSETITLTSWDVNEGEDILLSNLNDCKVIIMCVASTIHCADLSKCTLVCAPVKTSVFIDRCTDCNFVISCQQLRTHQTTQSDFYLHVTSKGIIEDCNNVRFGPYNLTYSNLEKDFQASGLSQSVNNWNKIDDFNWLSSDQASPNWSIIPEDQRNMTWL